MELAQWERFALNRLPSEGKPEQTRPFEVTALPDELAFEVSAGLLFARDRDAVKSVFAGAGGDLSLIHRTERKERCRGDSTSRPFSGFHHRDTESTEKSSATSSLAHSSSLCGFAPAGHQRSAASGISPAA